MERPLLRSVPRRHQGWASYFIRRNKTPNPSFRFGGPCMHGARDSARLAGRPGRTGARSARQKMMPIDARTVRTYVPRTTSTPITGAGSFHYVVCEYNRMQRVLATLLRTHTYVQVYMICTTIQANRHLLVVLDLESTVVCVRAIAARPLGATIPAAGPGRTVRARRQTLAPCPATALRKALAAQMARFQCPSLFRVVGRPSSDPLHASRQRIGKRRKSYSCRCMHALLRFFFILFRALCVRDVRTKTGDVRDRARARFGRSASSSSSSLHAVRLAARVRYIPARVNSRCMPIGYIGYYTFITLLVNS
jgi:hypothetical protein